MLEFLLGYLQAAAVHRDRNKGLSPEAWRDSLMPNPWAEPIGARIQREVERLERSMHALRSRPGEARMLEDDGGREFARVSGLLMESDARLSSSDAWSHLFEVGKALCMVSRERIDPKTCRRSLPQEFDSSKRSPEEWQRRTIWFSTWRRAQAAEGGAADLIWLVDHLRNRCSHGPSPEKRAEWVAIQGAVAGILGRTWQSDSGPKHPQYSADDDLSLIGEECLIVKHWLIMQMCDAADRIAVASGW
jgi:hypothetical protein